MPKKLVRQSYSNIPISIFRCAYRGIIITTDGNRKAGIRATPDAAVVKCENSPKYCPGKMLLENFSGYPGKMLLDSVDKV